MLWRGFQKPKRLAVDTETLTEKYGKFSAQPFERGFGTTIGNALRRTLLSSIEGAAVTAVKIEGVLHEFQSITGVVEDATDIILNLKQIPFKLNGEGPKALGHRAGNTLILLGGPDANPSALSALHTALQEYVKDSTLFETAVALSANDQVADQIGHLEAAEASRLGIEGSTLLAIRPDGYVGLRSDQNHLAALESYAASLQTGTLRA